MNDIQRAAGQGLCTALLALDVSAAFDAVHPETLRDRARTVFGVNDVALDWIRSFVSVRTQQIGEVHSVRQFVRRTAGLAGYVLFGMYVLVRPSGRGTVHSRPHKIFLHFHDLWTLLNKIREGVAPSPLSVLHKTH